MIAKNNTKCWKIFLSFFYTAYFIRFSKKKCIKPKKSKMQWTHCHQSHRVINRNLWKKNIPKTLITRFPFLTSIYEDIAGKFLCYTKQRITTTLLGIVFENVSEMHFDKTFNRNCNIRAFCQSNKSISDLSICAVLSNGIMTKLFLFNMNTWVMFRSIGSIIGIAHITIWIFIFFC